MVAYLWYCPLSHWDSLNTVGKSWLRTQFSAGVSRLQFSTLVSVTLCPFLSSAMNLYGYQLPTICYEIQCNL